MKKTVLFYRNAGQFSGGNLKVLDYYHHVMSSSTHVPKLYYPAGTVWDKNNPWTKQLSGAEERWRPDEADAVFIGGTDWSVFPAEERADFPVPIINIIQHVRHADPGDIRYNHLKNKAVRICVSPEVRDAINKTPGVNGPVYLIDLGIDHDVLPRPAPQEKRRTDVLIVGVKNTGEANIIARRLSQSELRVKILTENVLRSAFIDMLNDAKCAVFLPSPTEGFYLPALEGMAVGTFVICPDCVGNRGFCRNGENCLVPGYSVEEILRSVLDLMRFSEERKREMLLKARAASEYYDIKRERSEFLSLLNDLDNIWQKA